MSWTAQAEALAAELPELGGGAAVLNAGCWQAGVDPEATTGLVGAALTLGAPLSALFPVGPEVADDRQMLEHTSDLEAGTAELLKAARDMGRDVEHALAAAHASAAAAAAAAAEAKTSEEKAAAGGALAAAQAEIADCEAALDILNEAIARLEHALGRLQMVPGDLAATYEKPYDLVRRGGKLPHWGDFLTGAPTR
jgi:hypothetical protein